MTLTDGQLYLIIGIWSLTLIRSILIMFGKKVFKDASISEKSSMYPILNLYSMLEAVDVSSYLGILLFIPIINLIPLVVMSIKLGSVYNCDFGFKMGLVFLPIIFYPVLFKSDKLYKNKSSDTFSALDSVKSESINLMTEEDIKKENDSPYELDPVVDSIFKSKIDTMEEAPEYRAVKIDKDVLDKLSSLSMDDSDFKPIEKQENVSYFDNNIEDESIFKSKIDTMEEAPEYKATKVDKDVLDKMNSLSIDDSDFKPIEKQENKTENDEDKESKVEFIDL